VSEQRRQSGKGYGNIYTPHAGSMIIQVQRESGLQNRTLVLSPRQVRLLRLATSRYGLIAATLIVGSWAFFAVQAARVPLLRNRIVSMEQDAAKLDTLQHTVVELQRRYEQVQRMMGVAPAVTALPTDEPRTQAVRPEPAPTETPDASSGASAPAAVPATDVAATGTSANVSAGTTTSAASRRRVRLAPRVQTPAPVQTAPAPVQAAPGSLPTLPPPTQSAPPDPAPQPDGAL
jgi:hypothetical protein